MKDFQDRFLITVFFFVIILLCGALYYSHIKPVHPVGRFQPITPNTALDTSTGRLCWSYDPLGNGSDRIPLCSNLK